MTASTISTTPTLSPIKSGGFRIKLPITCHLCPIHFPILAH